MIALAVILAGALAAAWLALIVLAALWATWLGTQGTARGRAVAPAATARLARLLPPDMRGEAHP